MSLDINFDDIFTRATEIINSMWPIFVMPLGIVFGFGILKKIIGEVRGSIGGH